MTLDLMRSRLKCSKKPPHRSLFYKVEVLGKKLSGWRLFLIFEIQRKMKVIWLSLFLFIFLIFLSIENLYNDSRLKLSWTMVIKPVVLNSKGRLASTLSGFWSFYWMNSLYKEIGDQSCCRRTNWHIWRCWKIWGLKYFKKNYK